VLWDRERVISSLESENEEIRRLKDEINRNAQSSTYFARMQLGRLIEGALEEAGNTYVRDIHEALKPAAVASRSSKPIGDRMILNAAFLIDREQERAFDDLVKNVSASTRISSASSIPAPGPPTTSSTSSSSSKRRPDRLIGIRDQGSESWKLVPRQRKP
jgi:hypothetical protein